MICHALSRVPKLAAPLGKIACAIFILVTLSPILLSFTALSMLIAIGLGVPLNAPGPGLFRHNRFAVQAPVDHASVGSLHATDAQDAALGTPG